MANTGSWVRVSIVLALTSGGCVGFGGGGARRVSCQPLISYQGRTYKMSGLNVPGHVTIADLSAEPKMLQTAAEIAQVLDILRIDRCQALNRLDPKDPTYAAQALESNRTSEAIGSLAVIMWGRQRGQPDGQTELQLANWISSHIANALTVKETLPTAQGIPLAQDFEAAKQQSPPLRSALEKFQGRGRALEVWDFLKEEQKAQIVQRCREAVALFAGSLGVAPETLKANIFIQGQDGYLYIPPGLVVNMDPNPIIRIPLQYGSAGVAYAEGKEQFTEIVPPAQPVTFVVGDDPAAEESQQRARRVLLPPEDMRLVTASWVASLPVKNAARQVIAVLNLSSTVPQTEQQLRSAYSAHRGDLVTLTQRIASQLVL